MARSESVVASGDAHGYNRRLGSGMDLGLKGKVAMVAGASRGLGFAVAQALAREGALVSIASRDEAAIGAAAQRLGRRQALGDAGRRASRPKAFSAGRDATEDKFGGVDLLFANAGGPPAGAGAVVRRCGVAGRGRICCCSARCAWCARRVPSMKARGGGAILCRRRRR